MVMKDWLSPSPPAAYVSTSSVEPANVNSVPQSIASDGFEPVPVAQHILKEEEASDMHHQSVPVVQHTLKEEEASDVLIHQQQLQLRWQLQQQLHQQQQQQQQQQQRQQQEEQRRLQQRYFQALLLSQLDLNVIDPTTATVHIDPTMATVHLPDIHRGHASIPELGSNFPLPLSARTVHPAVHVVKTELEAETNTPVDVSHMHAYAHTDHRPSFLISDSYNANALHTSSFASFADHDATGTMHMTSQPDATSYSTMHMTSQLLGVDAQSRRPHSGSGMVMQDSNSNTSNALQALAAPSPIATATAIVHAVQQSASAVAIASAPPMVNATLSADPAQNAAGKT